MIFPEINYDKVVRIHGMDITIVTTAGRDDVAMALLRELGVPFHGERRWTSADTRRGTDGQEVLQCREGQADAKSPRGVHRCQRCGRSRAVRGTFGLCRICLPDLALRGEIAGVRKSQLVSVDRTVWLRRSERTHEHDSPVADVLTRIRNACLSPRHRRVNVPVSKLKVEMARLLRDIATSRTSSIRTSAGTACCGCS